MTKRLWRNFERYWDRRHRVITKLTVA